MVQRIRNRSSAERARSRGRQYEHQVASLDNATRKGQPWTNADLELLTDSGLTVGEIAARLGRTYKAVVQQRVKCNQQQRQ